MNNHKSNSPHPAKIKQISIKNFASYEEAVDITPKKYTFIYGLNGSGKTIISKYLANLEDTKAFGSCSIDFVNPTNTPEIFVYNEDYIKETFYNNPKQKGIFTLGKDNSDALTAIQDAQNSINEIVVKEQDPLANKLLALQAQKSTSVTDITELLWKNKKTYEKTSLEECMAGVKNDKGKFKNKILATDIDKLEQETDIQSSLDILKTNMETLNSDSLKEKERYIPVEYTVLKIEKNQIWAEVITGASESYLSDVIATLNNENWINDGINKYLEQSEVCPFCVRGLDTELKDKIKAHIDKTYLAKVNNLADLQTLYISYHETIKNALDSYSKDTKFVKENNLYNNAAKALIDIINRNLNTIREKVRTPNNTLTLLSSNNACKAVNSIVEEVNTEIQEYNKMVVDRDAAKEKITTQFWQLLCLKDSPNIKEFIKLETDLNSKISSRQEEQKKIQAKVTEQQKIIDDNTKNVANINEAVDWINDHLKSMGAEGFSIGKIKENGLDFYKIIRNHDKGNNAAFNNLSEGEKTLISFLYFMKSCTGTVNKSSPADLKNRVLVIDDPISSMSFNFIFEIASMIKRELLIKDTHFSQVIILTHHLYFMHELFYQINGNGTNEFKQTDYALYRLTKNVTTSIKDMSRNDIKNNYESYWQIVKDLKDGVNSTVLLPNAMRNILEHYFSFIYGKGGLHKALAWLGNDAEHPKFNALYRYINKESHSGPTNLTDMKELDTQTLMQDFQNIFEKNNNIAHFNSMMNS